MRSKFPDVEIPDVPLHHVIFSQVDKAKNRVAWIDGETGQSYTLSETRRISLQISAVLENRGLKKGDVVAVFLHNCPQFAFIVYGCMALGVTVSTISTAFTHGEVITQLKDCGATYLFTNDELSPTAHRAALETGQIKEIFTTGTVTGCTPFEEFTSYSGPKFEYRNISINPREDVALMPYSSGTTGTPKGVLLTHRNIVTNIVITYNDNMLDRTGPDTIDQLLLVLPMYHLYGLFLACGSTSRGDTLITMKKFNPEKFMQNIEKYKISDLFLVPPLIVFMNKSPLAKQFDLSSVKRIICAAAPLGRETEMEFRRLYPHVERIGQAYGMTELGPVATFMPAKHYKMGTLGVIAPNVEIQTVDILTGKVVGPNEHGELWVRSPGVMKGYLNKPEATRKTIDEQGWLHTGDIGYFDEEGYYYVIDRLKEMIKVKGLQVAPAELEALLLEHPGIADAAVTSIPDEKSGELPLGFIVKKPDSNITEEQVREFVAERVARYKQLAGGIRFVDQIPKSLSGKILRRVLRDQIRNEMSK